MKLGSVAALGIVNVAPMSACAIAGNPEAALPSEQSMSRPRTRMCCIGALKVSAGRRVTMNSCRASPLRPAKRVIVRVSWLLFATSAECPTARF